MSLGKSRPEAGRDPAGRGQRRGRDREALAFVLTRQAHLPQRRGDDFHVLGARAVDGDFSAGDRRDDAPAAGLDVVALQTMRRALASRRALDPNRRCADAFDRDAHRAQEQAELDDVRLHRRVADLGPAASGGRGQERRLGAGDRRLVQVERCAGQPVRRVERVPGLVDRHGAERHQRLDVRADGAPRGKVASGRRQAGGATPRQQRTEQQHGAAQLADEHRIGPLGGDRLALDPERRRARSLHRRAKALR